MSALKNKYTMYIDNPEYDDTYTVEFEDELSEIEALCYTIISESRTSKVIPIMKKINQALKSQYPEKDYQVINITPDGKIYVYMASDTSCGNVYIFSCEYVKYCKFNVLACFDKNDKRIGYYVPQNVVGEL